MLRPLNVLLVEDNPDDVFLMRTMLKKAGLNHSLTVLEDGAQAIAYMRELADAEKPIQPDLVFLDLNLPRKNGHEVLAEIRSHSVFDRLPIVVLTTSDDPADRSRAMAQGALRCTSKPPTLETFHQILRAAHLDGMAATGSYTLIDSAINTKLNSDLNPGINPGIHPGIYSSLDTGLESPAGGGQIRSVSDLTGKSLVADVLEAVKDSAARVLLIEDNPNDALFLKEILRTSAPGLYELEMVTDLAAALSVLSTNKFQLIIADLGLPDARGLDVLNKLHPAAKNIPIVILTGLDDEKKAAEAVEKGAQDYLVKGHFDGDRLLRSIRYAIMRKRADELSRLAITIENTALKEILEHAPISIARFGADLKVWACNAVFSRQVGLEPEAILGLPINDLMPATDPAFWLAVISEGTTFRIDRCKCTQASELFWDVTAWPVVSGEGDIKGGISVGLDVSERIKLEQQREDFAAALAHDIKNPLIGVDRILTALADSSLHSLEVEQQNFLGLLKESNNNVLGMLHNLLDVYRYDSAASHVELKLLDPIPVLKSIVSEFTSTAEAASVVIKLTVPDQLPLIKADEVALKRLFTNLLRNALQFSKNGSAITVGAESIQGGVLFQVRDNGPGLHPEEKDRLFKRFGQSSDGQLQVGPGNGLGLYLCKQIVDAMGGTISCDSKIGDGTTFNIILH
jgi:PAS domain S-box-containing protein